MYLKDLRAGQHVWIYPHTSMHSNIEASEARELDGVMSTFEPVQVLIITGAPNMRRHGGPDKRYVMCLFRGKLWLVWVDRIGKTGAMRDLKNRKPGASLKLKTKRVKREERKQKMYGSLT